MLTQVSSFNPVLAVPENMLAKRKQGVRLSLMERANRKAERKVQSAELMRAKRARDKQAVIDRAMGIQREHGTDKAQAIAMAVGSVMSTSSPTMRTHVFESLTTHFGRPSYETPTESKKPLGMGTMRIHTDRGARDAERTATRVFSRTIRDLDVFHKTPTKSMLRNMARYADPFRDIRLYAAPVSSHEITIGASITPVARVHIARADRTTVASLAQSPTVKYDARQHYTAHAFAENRTWRRDLDALRHPYVAASMRELATAKRTAREATRTERAPVTLHPQYGVVYARFDGDIGLHFPPPTTR